MNSFATSPLTGTDNVREVDSFDPRAIAELYLLQEEVDVARFFSGIDQLRLFECGDTGYRYFFPFETVGDEAFYQELQAAHDRRGLNYDRDWSPDHQVAFEQVSAGDNLLEIGCNRGKFLMRAREKTQSVTGLEFNELAAAQARAKGLNIVGDSIAEHAAGFPEQYDVVCAFQVLEHITSVGAFISDSLAVLKSGGRLIISVPNNEPYFQRFSKYEVLNLPPHHVGLWNIGTFRRLPQFFGVELEHFVFTGRTGFGISTYLRAKLIAGIRSLPTGHSLADKLKIIAASPFAAVMNIVDFLNGRENHAHVTVVFRKRG